MSYDPINIILHKYLIIDTFEPIYILANDMIIAHLSQNTLEIMELSSFKQHVY